MSFYVSCYLSAIFIQEQKIESHCDRRHRCRCREVYSFSSTSRFFLPHIIEKYIWVYNFVFEEIQ